MSYEIIQQDCLNWMRTIEANSVDTIITSPPYNLKGFRDNPTIPTNFWTKSGVDYGIYDDNMPELEYQKWQVDIINEGLRILKPNGSFFYQHKLRKWHGSSSHPMSWILKSNAKLFQEIIWDRKSTLAHRDGQLYNHTERIFWLIKDTPKVFRKQMLEEFKKDIWTIAPRPNPNHPAPFPEQLAENCILLTTQPGDVVYDPFSGSGTTVFVADRLDRHGIGTDIDPTYIKLSEDRLNPINKKIFNNLFEEER